MPSRDKEGPGYVQHALVRYDMTLKEREGKFNLLRYRFVQGSIFHIPQPSQDDHSLPPVLPGIRRDPINGLGLTKRHTRGYKPLFSTSQTASVADLPSLNGGSVNQSYRYQTTKEGFRDTEKERMALKDKEAHELRKRNFDAMSKRLAREGRTDLYKTRNYYFPLTRRTEVSS